MSACVGMASSKGSIACSRVSIYDGKGQSKGISDQPLCQRERERERANEREYTYIYIIFEHTLSRLTCMSGFSHTQFHRWYWMPRAISVVPDRSANSLLLKSVMCELSRFSCRNASTNMDEEDNKR